MKFRTEIPTPNYPFNITHDDHILFMGSCFSDHIGNYFKELQFHVLRNPFGTLFNPASIALALQLTLSEKPLPNKFIDFVNDKWISYAHHGKFSHPDKKIFLEQINKQLDYTRFFFKQCDYLFITFGTAFIYRLIERNLIVANCHKIPAQNFEKMMLTVNAITDCYKTLITRIQTINPNIKIIFTVSPVRHLGDGFHENQLSKSTLLLAVSQLVNRTNRVYFPAYEILQDDLRDYRFYASDLCHPGENAVNYVCEIVSASFFNSETIARNKEIIKENKRNGHIQKNGLFL